MSGAHVLLVEDNAITRRLVRAALETNGIGVSEAADGATALRLLASKPADLVLQDLVLPDIDGFELVTRLRALPGGSEMPILAVSGLLSKLEEARVSAVGFNDVITKPVEPARLLQIIRAHLPSEENVDACFGRGRRLLVADDDPVQRKLLCFRLGKLGFETTMAADGLEALDLARRSKPDAIISDVMMPGLDGFGLCVAIREDPELSRMPLVLVTNSYIEDVDRDLARRAGANGFVVRTPGMREIADALRVSLSPNLSPDARVPTRPPADLEGAWSRRVMSQLERQVSLNAGIAQRCATLSAELSILSGISDALAKEQHVEKALVDVLASCIDAGGIAFGALYLRAGQTIVLEKFGEWGPCSDEEIRTFFGRPDLLASLIAAEKTVRIPSESTSGAEAVLEKVGIKSAIFAPLTGRGEPVGALFMGSKNVDLDDDRLLFAEGVATQISQALTLSMLFTDKDQSERKSREQAAVLHSILESIGEGVLVTNRRGEVVVCNPAAEAILQRRPNGVPAERWAEHYGFLLPDTLEPVPPEDSPFLRAIAGESVDGMELLLRNEAVPQGPFNSISISAVPLRDEGDPLGGAVAVLRDVTLEKATRAQLMVADRLASVGMLAAGVAHEINNPLAAVLGNLDFALEKLAELEALTDGDEWTDLTAPLQDAREGAMRIRQIVRDLKVFSRSEKEKQGPVDVHRVLDLALRTASNEVRHRARVVQVYGTVPHVEGNEARLGQVFLNLIVNAAQAIPDGRADENEIRVTTRTDQNGRVVVDIADTGTGIAPDAMKRLFTPFFTTKPIGVGTGLGLSICHRLVAAVGGEITVESRLGMGTVFHVALLASKTNRISVGPPPLRSTPAERRGRVLIIDDENAIVEVVKRMLGPDHECVGMTNAKEAISRILAGDFDVVFCDLMMPVMTGMDVYAAVAAVKPEVANGIIFLTGGAFTARARAFLVDVPNDHLEKPFDARTLKALVGARLLR